jgi:hypothetical protein
LTKEEGVGGMVASRLGMLSVVAAALVGCLDMPILQVEKRKIPVDAGEDAIDRDTLCRNCLAAPEDPGPGCKIPYDACMANEKCNLVVGCGFETGCFVGSRRGFVGCGIPCLSKSGVLTGNDDVLTLASTLFQCFSAGECSNRCFTSE